MMTEQEERLFSKSFNQGYILQKHEAELLKKILATENKNSEQIKALALGLKKSNYSKNTNLSCNSVLAYFAGFWHEWISEQ